MSATRHLASHGVLSGLAPSSHRIIALLERTLTVSDPIRGLASLMELRRELDALERVYVARARRLPELVADKPKAPTKPVRSATPSAHFSIPERPALLGSWRQEWARRGAPVPAIAVGAG